MDELQAMGRTRQFLRGARFAFSGFKLVGTHPRLWPYVIAPMVLTMALFVALVVVAWPVLGWLLGLLWTPGDESGYGVTVLWYGFWLLVRVSVVVFGALVLYFTSGLLATPFNDRLSEEVETLVMGPYKEEFSFRVLIGDLANSLVHSVLSLTIWLSVLAVSSLLNLIPVVGNVASLVISGAATAIFLSRESMDGCLSRRRMTYRHKIRVVRAQWPMMLGFGSVGALLLWIPLMNFLILPMAVAGATLMYCQLEKAGLVPDATGAPGFKSARARNALLAAQDIDAEEITRDGLRVPVRQEVG